MSTDQLLLLHSARCVLKSQADSLPQQVVETALKSALLTTLIGVRRGKGISHNGMVSFIQKYATKYSPLFVATGLILVENNASNIRERLKEWVDPTHVVTVLQLADEEARASGELNREQLDESLRDLQLSQTQFCCQVMETRDASKRALAALAARAGLQAGLAAVDPEAAFNKSAEGVRSLWANASDTAGRILLEPNKYANKYLEKVGKLTSSLPRTTHDFSDTRNAVVDKAVQLYKTADNALMQSPQVRQLILQWLLDDFSNIPRSKL